MSVPGPVLGPCEPWIDGEDVAACCKTSVGSDPGLLDTVALEASLALFEISGRQFTGLCTMKVRPCRQACACFGSPSMGLGTWYWTAGTFGYGGGSWRNECGDRCGCGSLSKVRLAGYPVREILEVKLDGAVLDPSEYMLRGWRELTRNDDPGPPVQHQGWPSCQNLALDDDQPGTFSITYRHGVDPPLLGRDAAAELACQLWAACQKEPCKLPAGTTKVTRQGVQVERGLLANWFDPKKATGLVRLDLFLRAYWGSRSGRRPAVFSPDMQPFARRVAL